MARKGRADDLAPDPAKNGRDPIVDYWLDEIQACRKRENDFRKDGVRIRNIYSGEKPESVPMNILFSNTETIAPALYSQVPRPVVKRRYADDDPVGYAAAQAGQRMLEFLIDTNIDGYDTVDDCLSAVTLDALVPGRGISSLKYDAEVNDVTEGDQTTPYKSSELVCPEIRSWDRVYFGYARKWSRVPWVAYEEHIDEKEAKRLFGSDISAKISFSEGEDSPDTTEVDRRGADERNTGRRKTALIYQIWDKSGGRKIRYISPQYKEGYLKVDDDELKLTGFFNCPKPIQFISKTDDQTPTAPYRLYEQQATELNSLTVRITRLVKAIRARGVYDKELGDDIQKIMEGDDNELMAADKSSSLAAEKGLQNAIWFMPLETLVATLRELVGARENCKQVIYEITGISDIIRGASKASETLGAQQIKSQWGTLRIKPKQAEVQRYARDMLRIMLEIAATRFSESSWAKMTGLPYLTEAQINQGQQMMMTAQAQLQQAQTFSAQAQLMAQKAQQTQALASRAITPEQQQAIQVNQQKAQQAQQQIEQIQQQMQAPKWPEVLASLKDDIQRAYKIDIETNSTIEPEAAEDQKNIQDLLGAMAQFLQGIGPLVAQGVMPFQVAQSMLLAITRRYRFGDEIENQIRAMQAPPPPDNGAQKAQEQVQQVTQQAQQDKMAADGQIQNLTLQNKQMQGQMQSQQTDSALNVRASDLALREQKLRDEEARFRLEQKHAVDAIKNNVAVESTKLEAKKQTAQQGEKNAQQTHKQAQAISQTVDDKVNKAVETLSGMIDKMKEIEASIGEKVTMAKVLQTVAAPRKRTAVRGKDGRIESTVDEPLQ